MYACTPGTMHRSFRLFSLNESIFFLLYIIVFIFTS